MSKLKLLLFMGSTREGRMGDRVLTFVKQKIVAHGAFELTVLDPLEMQLPMLSKPLHFYKDRSEAPQLIRDTNELIIAADAFLIVTPEYNCVLPPALTNLMDHFPPKSYSYRPCGIVSYSLGPLGGVRAQMGAQHMMTELGAVNISAAMSMPKVTQLLDEQGTLLNQDYNAKAERVLKQLAWYSEALKNHKALSPPTV